MAGSYPLLSKCWLRRHHAIEDHEEGLLTLRGKNGQTVKTPLTPAQSSGIEVDFPRGTDRASDSEDEMSDSDRAWERDQSIHSRGSPGTSRAPPRADALSGQQEYRASARANGTPGHGEEDPSRHSSLTNHDRAKTEAV